MPIEYYMIIALCWGFGGIITGLAGFGAALIAMPIIAMKVPMHIAVPCGTLVAFFMNSQMAVTYRKSIDWKRMVPMICAAPFGAFAGVLFARSADGSYLQLCLGLLLGIYATWALIFDGKKERPPIHKNWGILAGFSSAAIGTSIGMGGPPTIVFTALSGWSKDTVKGGITGFFVAAACFMIPLQIWAGIQSVEALMAACIGVPAVYIGTRTGIKMAGRIGEKSYRKNLFRMLNLFAVIILYKALGNMGMI